MDRNQSHLLEKVKSIVDLGVHLDSNLTFKDHILEKINKAFVIKRNFIYMDKHTFVFLYKAMVHPHILFGVVTN